ncbi:MAG: ATP-binding cassette domain-containing protein [Geminicoccaceae bacterium]
MLALEELHARYGAIAALRGVTIEVNEGELVALIGANGAGKTTTLSAIAGVIRPARGSIVFKGESIAGLPPEAIVRKGIAMVPEDREIFPALTVEQNLRLGAFVRHDREEYRHDLEEMCDLFPILRARLDQPGGTLSGGEQQQLAIARALMSHPKLLMLDEPSLGLAPRLVGQVFELIRRLHAGGTTNLLVEQNVSQTLKIADRAYVIRIGRLEAALAHVVITPSIHWVHHHKVRADTDSNYGTLFSFWDPLFRSRSLTAALAGDADRRRGPQRPAAPSPDHDAVRPPARLMAPPGADRTPDSALGSRDLLPAPSPEESNPLKTGDLSGLFGCRAASIAAGQLSYDSPDDTPTTWPLGFVSRVSV